MDSVNKENALAYITKILHDMVTHGASDLFIAADFPPSFKAHGSLDPIPGHKSLTTAETALIADCLMNDKQREEFARELECNFAIAPEGIGRFRVNAYVQLRNVGMVLRTITSKIPNFDELNLPPKLKDVVMEKRGLVLLVGGTGSGKSTTLAAMIDYRNRHSKGHIITIEDPVEYVHHHHGCVVSHREVGVDTHSWHHALKNTLRQAPDVILIGEIRDMETMEHAIAFAETGHLCMSTLHANNANQALDRIINFFPSERREQLLMDLSLNMKGIVSQRLIPKQGGGRAAAIEILLNSPIVSDLIFKGEIGRIKEAMSKSRELGMQTFDQCLFDFYESGVISFEDAMRNADGMNDLRLNIKLNSHRFRKEGSRSSTMEAAPAGLSLQEEKKPAVVSEPNTTSAPGPAPAVPNQAPAAASRPAPAALPGAAPAAAPRQAPAATPAAVPGSAPAAAPDKQTQTPPGGLSLM